MTIFDLRFRFHVVCVFLLLAVSLLLLGCRERITYVDKFDGNSTISWILEADEMGSTQYEGGQLQFSIPAAGVARYARAEGLDASNFVTEVEVTQLAGSTNAGYGLLFRLQDTESFYRFNITGNGYYMVEKRSAGGNWVRLTNDWQQTSLLLTGLNNRNLLKVEARDTSLSFAINGFEVFSINDGEYASGGIALNAGTFDQGGLVVAFDNFSLETR